MRALFRFPALIALLLTGLTLASAIRLSRGRFAPAPIAAWWSRQLLRTFNVRARFSGHCLPGPQVQVANHISWLDMFVLATRGHYRYVAKSEVARWPVASTLANAMGTVYIRRGKGGAAPVLTATRPLLAAGGFFLFFPEGTTTDGRRLKPFHGRLLTAAQDARCPVQPIAIRYRTPDGLPHVAPFIGDDDLISHIWRLLKHPGFRVDVSYCPPLESVINPDAAAVACRTAVASALGIVDGPPSLLPEAA